MTRKSQLLLVFALAGLALAAFAGACKDDGGGTVSLEEYFRQLDELQNRTDSRIDEVPDPFEEDISQEEAIGRVSSSFDELAAAVQDLHDDLHELEPADEASDEHERLLTATDGILAVTQGFAERAQDVDTPDELEEFGQGLFESTDVVDAFNEFEAACKELQALADANNIDVDLECNEDDAGEPLAIGEYFERLEAIFDTAGQHSDDLQAEFDRALDEAASVEEQKEALQTFLNGIIAVFGSATRQMDDLSPPEEAAPAHDDFLSAAAALSKLAEDFENRLADADTEEEIRSLVEEFDQQTMNATARGDDACRDLQDLAGENQIDVDLDCRE